MRERFAVSRRSKMGLEIKKSALIGRGMRFSPVADSLIFANGCQENIEEFANIFGQAEWGKSVEQRDAARRRLHVCEGDGGFESYAKR